MADAKPVLLNFRGGRNGMDPLYALLPGQCVEAMNIDWYGSLLGRKRGGSTALSLTGGTAVTGPINALFRHLPGNDETKAEFWRIDNAATPVVSRLAGGTAWADVTMDDAITGRPMDVNFVSFNGKVFIAYQSAVDRLHVYDPTITPAVSVSVLLVGGGGGSGATGSGGGAGGYRSIAGHTVSVQSYNVVVGPGGAGGIGAGAGSNGASGTASTFDGLSAAGGGGGGGEWTGATDGPAPLAGGSGGGGAPAFSTGGSSAQQNGAAGNTPSTSPSQGNTGGNGAPLTNDTTKLAAGGGGGSAAVGSNADGSGNGGNGGAGTSNSISGSPVTYAQGGGGVGNRSTGTNGTPNTAGTANTGNGAGNVGLAGGSGIVIISYPTGAFTATGGAITTSGGNTIHTFTASGTWVVTAIAATPAVRRVGLATSAAGPTAANTGSGSWAATTRYYRVRWAQGNFASGLFAWPSIVVRVSEPTPVVSFTPSGSGLATHLTQPTAPGERETHWLIEGSTDNVIFYMLAAEPVATTTYDDANSAATLTAQPFSEPIGTYALPGAAKFLITDGNRILLSGSSFPGGANSGGKNNRVWWTPVLGSSNHGDDERVPVTLSSFTDLEENAGDTITGFGGPLFAGVIFTFMYRRVWRLTPTGDVTVPYLSRKVSDSIGLVHQKAVDLGDDETGQPALYFVDPHKGSYRVGSAGFQYLGHDNEDRWKGLNGLNAVNLSAANIPATVIYYPDIHQVWMTIATGTSDDPDTVLCFDTQLGEVQANGEVRKGWSIHTPPKARCTALFANTIGASMSRDLKPYTGLVATAVVLKRDTADKDDNGAAFQGFVTSGVVLPGTSLGVNVGVLESILCAKPLGSGAAPVTITQSLIRDFGIEIRTSTVVLTPVSSETRVIVKFEGSALALAGALQLTLGDAAAVASGQWSLEGCMIPLESQGDR